MNKQITQEQINRAAWAACDTFRGVMDPANYKDYILVMLFLKYISDIWKHDVAEYQKRFNNDDSLINCYLKKERFFLPEGTSFYDLFAKRNEADIGALINEALGKIEKANGSKLTDVFRNIEFNSESSLGKTKERNSRLKSLLEDFNKPALDLNPDRVKEDIIGECYIYLISNFASSAGKKAGEFYTPAQVSRLLAKLAAPKPGDIICDPACGSGSLLIYAAEEVNNYNTKLSDQEENHSETKKVKKDNYALFG